MRASSPVPSLAMGRGRRDGSGATIPVWRRTARGVRRVERASPRGRCSGVSWSFLAPPASRLEGPRPSPSAMRRPASSRTRATSSMSMAARWPVARCEATCAGSTTTASTWPPGFGRDATAWRCWRATSGAPTRYGHPCRPRGGVGAVAFELSTGSPGASGDPRPPSHPYGALPPRQTPQLGRIVRRSGLSRSGNIA